VGLVGGVEGEARNAPDPKQVVMAGEGEVGPGNPCQQQVTREHCQISNP